MKLKKLFILVISFIFCFSMLFAKKNVKIGFIYILSGPFSVYGKFAKQRAELAIEQINKNSGFWLHYKIFTHKRKNYFLKI